VIVDDDPWVRASLIMIWHGHPTATRREISQVVQAQLSPVV
jgi:hypothetical protein